MQVAILHAIPGLRAICSCQFQSATKIASMPSPSFPTALPRVSGPVFVLDAAHLRQGIEASRSSPRRRIMLPVNRNDTEGVQRLVNFLQRGSYIRAHRHPMPECTENVAVLQGAVLFLTFDDAGTIVTSHKLTAGDAASCMIDIEQDVWHTFLTLADDTVVLEIKRGPYDAKTDKQFAAWSPEEGTVAAEEWMRRVLG
jgi:cupin fold WbuC family metalloprotein